MALIWYAKLVAIGSIVVSYGTSAIITNPVETQSVGTIIAIVVIVLCIFLLAVVIGLKNSCAKWKILKLQHDDHTIADRIFRTYYQFRLKTTIKKDLGRLKGPVSFYVAHFRNA
ncbi:hypothetical protein SASPL_144212 [Salvia splendens]|uniref:Uncharacterized protein n=1 Tax=Salvia splendens TaxID=180675 RepID=A0A8X8ZAG0_SALSN|nr:hypothetical protein SASPL_144212 [Salvia splendens]